MFQVITAAVDTLRGRLFAAAREVHRVPPIQGEIGEAALGRPPIEKVRVTDGARCRNRHAFPKQDESVRLRIRQRPQEHRIDHAKDGGVGADPERERDDRDHAEGGRLDQHADGVSKISQHQIGYRIFRQAASFRTQGDHGIDPGGAARRQPAGRDRRAEEEGSDAQINSEVRRLDLKENAAQQAGKRDRAADPE